MKTLTAIAILTVASFVQAAEKPAKDYRLGCWDQTFAYNIVSVEGTEDKINVKISGQSREVLKDFMPADAQGNDRVDSLKLSFPRSGCLVRDNDKKQLICIAGHRATPTVPVEVTIIENFNPVKTQLLMKNIQLEIRKVESVSFFAKETVGYELVLDGNLVGKPAHQGALHRSVRQSYNYGLEEDNTKNCELDPEHFPFQ